MSEKQDVVTITVSQSDHEKFEDTRIKLGKLLEMEPADLAVDMVQDPEGNVASTMLYKWDTKDIHIELQGTFIKKDRTIYRLVIMSPHLKEPFMLLDGVWDIPDDTLKMFVTYFWKFETDHGLDDACRVH